MSERLEQSSAAFTSLAQEPQEVATRQLQQTCPT